MPLSHCLLPPGAARNKWPRPFRKKGVRPLTPRPSTSATCHRTGPVLPLSVMPVPRVPRATRARQCTCELVAPPGARPAPSLSSWRPTPPPRAPQTTPRSPPLPPEPFPRPPVRRVEPRVSYLRPPRAPSLLLWLSFSPVRSLGLPIRPPEPSLVLHGRS